ncbi:MAG: FadR/GntR family transcriptional regulator [Sphaerobacter sp.]|nr:FadR/GntR family transcriptional regulator [Sphaerobacter sp.]
MVQPIRRLRLSQQIVAQICQLIRQGYLRPGDRLPPERDLADQLQVSRASLREALRGLEIAGIIESRHGGGTYVRDGFSSGLISPLALVLEASGDLLGDLWEVRIIVEPDLAALAALRATPEHIAALEEVVRQQAAELAHPEEDRATHLDRQFHVALAQASENAVAVQVIQLMNRVLQGGRRHFHASPERRRRAYHWHQEILGAIRARQPDAARDAMLRHLREVEEFILGSVVATRAPRSPEPPRGAPHPPTGRRDARADRGD